MTTALSCAAAFAAAMGASYPPDCALARADGVIERAQTAPSPALGRSIGYVAYRPAKAPADGRNWPTLYLLEGRPSETDWLDQGFVHHVIDGAVRDGVIPPMLVVIASAPFSWYVDNPDPGGQGAIGQAISHDLVEAIDARYPTAACREARAVAGLSMGGYGALLFALDSPERFGAAASLAGAIAAPIARGDEARARRADAFYDGVFGRPLTIERFNRQNLFTKVEAARGAPGPKPAAFLAIGDRDRGGIMLGATRLHVELLRGGFDSTLRIGPGAHNWETWSDQLREALEWLGPRIDASCGRAAAAGNGKAAAIDPSPDLTGKNAGSADR